MTAPIIPTLTVEMDFGEAILDMTGEAILDTIGDQVLDLGWTDVIADVRASQPIKIRRGNFGNEPNDRVADIGTLKLALDNSEANSADTLGYYSPDHANHRWGFDDNTRVRLALEYNGKKRYKFQGRVSDVRPDSGRYGRRITQFEAEDWMAEAASTPMRGLTVQVDQKDDELITTLLGIMDHPPASTDLSVGPDVYPLSFTDELGESTKVLAVLQKIALSGAGMIFVIGDETTGEILQYRNRQDIGQVGAPVATINNSMIRIAPYRKTRKKIKEVVVSVHPNYVDASPTTVLFTLQKEIVILAGETVSFSCRYRDPNGASTRISGTDLVTPVAGTHYKFSSTSGSGTDLNASLEFLQFAEGADQVDVTVRNNAAVTGYFWFLEVMGKGIYRYDVLEAKATSTVNTKGDTLNYDMPYQDDLGVGQSIANIFLTFYEGNETDVPDVEFIANRNAELMDALLDVEPGTLIAAVEDVTAINNLFYVNGVDITIHRQATKINVVWSLVPAKLVDFSVWDENLWDEEGPVYAY